MVISSIAGTALAASCPRTSSRIPPRGTPHPPLPLVAGDRVFIKPRHRLGRLLPPDLLQNSPPRDRDHHDAGRPALTLEALNLDPQGVAEDQLLQGEAGAEAERPGG